MFADSAAYQNFSAIVARETTYQIQRLSHHPAIAIWDGYGCTHHQRLLLATARAHAASDLHTSLQAPFILNLRFKWRQV